MLTNFSLEENALIETIKDVLVDHEIEINFEISREQKLIDDLEFTSLMFAQLLMMLEEKTEYDPFSDEQNEIAISDMVTVGNILSAYCGY
jgi:acyl carrier protein